MMTPSTSRLTRWQWGILLVPPIALIVSLVIIASVQIHAWRLSWVWGLVAVGAVGWRWLLGHWTHPNTGTLELDLKALPEHLQITLTETAATVPPEQVEAVLRQTLAAAQEDRPLWEDWPTFSQRCQQLIQDIARLYHPDVKHPLLNIYVPQAYGLLRGTVDDLDRWMQVVAPTLNQVSVSQVYQTYETYQTFKGPLSRLWSALGLAQWLWNPLAAAAERVSRPWGEQANRLLVTNFSHILREMALTTLCRQAIALYGGQTALAFENTAPAAAPTQTLRVLMEQAQPPAAIASDPVNLLLVGRTGAGKSSLINTLFEQAQAAVDVLPSTDQITSYRWETPTQETLLLWDSPGYEQVDQAALRHQVLEQVAIADVLLLVTSALDPALAADLAFLQDVALTGRDLPIFLIVTQVDRLRPVREWQPPYDWQGGDRPKERHIREAIAYRAEQLGDRVQQIFPLVTAAPADDRVAWGSDALAVQLIEAIAPAKSQRLAQFLRSREARVVAAARLIERYAIQMTSGQGIIALVKTPLLSFIAARFTGIPDLGALLAQSIPAEQVPVIASKLMLTYELQDLLTEQKGVLRPSEMLTLWPLLLLHNDRSPAQNAWAWGQALVEYWTQELSVEILKVRFEYYLEQQEAMPAQVRDN